MSKPTGSGSKTPVDNDAWGQWIPAGEQSTWLITGAGGFIGSHLIEYLLKKGQQVVAMDNFATGHRANVDVVCDSLPDQMKNFRLVEGDICDLAAVAHAMTGVDYVLHQAGLGSVPRSIEFPLNSFASNVSGFMNVAIAAKDAGVRQLVYASSSSVYGDHPALPKVEDATGQPLSPYAATKAADELFAAVIARSYGLTCVGLRYFNVFGPRQDPDGPYAAVVPRWLEAMCTGKPVNINGDGETSRDFCYVANAVQANVRGALASLPDGSHEVFNIAAGARTTLNALHQMLAERLAKIEPHFEASAPVYKDFRPGDVRHSLADVTKAQRLIGYVPEFDIARGLDVTVPWYLHAIAKTREAAVARE